MQMCRRCGSLRTRVIRGSIVDRLLALVLGQDVVVCSRCGRQRRQPRSFAHQTTRARRVRPEGERGRGHLPLDLTDLDRVLEMDRPAKPVNERRERTE